MHSRIIAEVALSLALASTGCASVEPSPPGWPEPDARMPSAHAELVRQCRATAMQRRAKTNRAIRTEAVLVWAGGATLASGAVTATLAGLETRQREGVVGAAAITTITAGVALGARLLAPAADQRERHEATRAHEQAAARGLWMLADVEAEITQREQSLEPGVAGLAGPTLSELLRFEEELEDYVVNELSSCTAVDPRPPPAPLPTPPRPARAW